MNQPDLLDDAPEFKNKSEEKCVESIAEIAKFLKQAKKDVIPIGLYEHHYRRLRGIKKFYDNIAWDKIGEDIKEDWFVNARKDKEFKKYYKLRVEFDRLEVLAK